MFKRAIMAYMFRRMPSEMTIGKLCRQVGTVMKTDSLRGDIAQSDAKCSVIGYMLGNNAEIMRHTVIC